MARIAVGWLTASSSNEKRPSGGTCLDLEPRREQLCPRIDSNRNSKCWGGFGVILRGETYIEARIQSLLTSSAAGFRNIGLWAQHNFLTLLHIIMAAQLATRQAQLFAIRDQITQVGKTGDHISQSTNGVSIQLRVICDTIFVLALLESHRYDTIPRTRPLKDLIGNCDTAEKLTPDS